MGHAGYSPNARLQVIQANWRRWLLHVGGSLSRVGTGHPSLLTTVSRVYQAVHPETHAIAACKVVTITPDFSEWQMKSIDKECKVHNALKHKHILEMLGAAKLSIEQAQRGGYLPAYYLLLEMAAGGDLFDKIGTYPQRLVRLCRLQRQLQHRMLGSTKTSPTSTFVR